MNFGLYSFKTLELNKIKELERKIMDNFPNANKICIYSENTNKQRLCKRDGLEKMLTDYTQKKIDFIAFENIEALGTELYIATEVIEKLNDSNVNFIILDRNIKSNSLLGKDMIKIITAFGKFENNEMIKRSKAGMKK